jgi:hypothetical protein
VRREKARVRAENRGYDTGALQRGSEKRYYPLQHGAIGEKLAEMARQVAVVLYVVSMAAVIVGVDLVFFRNRFWERLTVNIGIVLVFAAVYLKLFRRP